MAYIQFSLASAGLLLLSHIAAFTLSCRLSEGTLPLSLANCSQGFHVSMLAIILILRSVALVLMSTGLIVIGAQNPISECGGDESQHLTVEVDYRSEL